MESEPGKGSAFTFRASFEQATASAAPSCSSAAGPEDALLKVRVEDHDTREADHIAVEVADDTAENKQQHTAEANAEHAKRDSGCLQEAGALVPDTVVARVECRSSALEEHLLKMLASPTIREVCTVADRGTWEGTMRSSLDGSSVLSKTFAWGGTTWSARSVFAKSVEGGTTVGGLENTVPVLVTDVYKWLPLEDQSLERKDNAGAVRKTCIILLAYAHQQHLAKKLVQRAFAARRPIVQLLQPISSRDLLEALQRVTERRGEGFDRDSGSGAAGGSIGMVAGGPDGGSAGRVPPPKEKKKKRTSGRAAKRMGEKLRVLVVDDVETNRMLLGSMLKR